MAQARARAPGRVNLIGEHTDYNGGFVMPCAIPYQTTVLARERSDSAIAIAAAFEDAGTVRYVTGIISELRNAGLGIPGVDLEIAGDLPVGAGLSSSASLEVAVALAALELAGIEMDRAEIARLAQRAEIEHVGAHVGIMDQFAVLFARAGYALFLDTRTLQYTLVPVPAVSAIRICDTMVKHELASGEYNVRRQQCEESVKILSTRYPEIKQLRDVTPQQLEEAKGLLDPLLYRRARHVVWENERVVAAREALIAADLPAFGTLMNASHASLRDDYEVSTPELDLMVELARGLPGVYGARMTGGGFGGCTVNLVARSDADAFTQLIAERYWQRTGVVPAVYDGTPADAAQAQR